MPANLIWGAAFLLTLALIFLVPPLGLVTFLFLLPFPTAGLYRLAAMIVRGEPTNMSDALAWRSFARRAVGAGVIVGGVSVVLGFNMLTGLGSLDPLGWGFATAAFWGLIVLWLVAAAVWPLLFDPLRADEPATSLVRLALVVILVRPLPYLAFAGVLAVVLFVSTILFAALLTVSIAYLALATAAYVIPGADRIEDRRTFVVIS